MKKIIVAVVVLPVIASSAFADSSVNFANGNSVGLPIVTFADGTGINSANYVAQLFETTDGGVSFGAVGTTSSFFTVASTSVRAGVWKSQSITLTGVNPGSVVTFKIAVWDSTLFDSYDADAYAIATPGPLVFWSGVTPAFTYNAPAIGDLNPADFNLSNFKGLTLNYYNYNVPEPSVIALGALGLGALLWRRRN